MDWRCLGSVGGEEKPCGQSEGEDGEVKKNALSSLEKFTDPSMCLNSGSMLWLACRRPTETHTGHVCMPLRDDSGR